MFAKNSFVRWTATDAEGTFTHVGKVIKDSATFIVLATDVGEMTIDKSEGTFVAVSKKSSSTKKTPTSTVTVKPGTTKYQVFKLLEGKNVSRKEAIEMIVAAGLSTAAGASTHYNSVKNII